MPHQFSNGMQGYNSHNQLSPTPQVGLVPASRGGPPGPPLHTGEYAPLMQPSAIVTRNEEKRLTREAMERYLKDRNDMVLVILHAKVSFTTSRPSLHLSYLLHFSTPKARSSLTYGEFMIEKQQPQRPK